MRKITLLFTILLILSGVSAFAQLQTFCNPLNLEYRFALDNPSRREAADPEIVLYRDDYYLFASKSGGYWTSPDMRDWRFIKPEGLPLEDYAPTVLVLGDKMYLTGSRSKALFETDDPKAGKWRRIAEFEDYPDPA